MISRIMRGHITKAALVYGAAFLLLASCKSNNLRPDTASISAIDANYPTVEFSAKENLYHGYGIVQINPGESLDVKIQGYYSGSIRLDGQCLPEKIDKAYDTNQVISITVRPTKSCFLRVVMTSVYGKNKEPVTVYPILGYLAVKVADTTSHDWHVEARRRKSGVSTKVYLGVGGDGSSKVIADGCGKRFEFEAEIHGGIVVLDLKDLVQKDTCILEGYATSNQYAPLRFSILSVTYNKTYPELSHPKVVILKNGKLWIQAEESVSILSFDKEYYFMNDITVQKFDPNSSHIIRAITAKGRTAIGVWTPEKKGVVWKN